MDSTDLPPFYPAWPKTMGGTCIDAALLWAIDLRYLNYSIFLTGWPPSMTSPACPSSPIEDHALNFSPANPQSVALEGLLETSLTASMSAWDSPVWAMPSENNMHSYSFSYCSSTLVRRQEWFEGRKLLMVPQDVWPYSWHLDTCPRLSECTKTESY